MVGRKPYTRPKPSVVIARPRRVRSNRTGNHLYFSTVPPFYEIASSRCALLAMTNKSSGTHTVPDLRLLISPTTWIISIGTRSNTGLPRGWRIGRSRYSPTGWKRGFKPPIGKMKRYPPSSIIFTTNDRLERWKCSAGWRPIW
jgi:hypothetical protein